MKNIFFIPVVAGTLLVACGESKPVKKMPSPSDPIPVKIVRLAQHTQGNLVFTSGQFTTDDETVLSFKTGGVISKIYVREGDRVKAGQVLATLDMTEISAQVNQANIAVEKATRDFKRAEALYRDSVATLEQFQNARTALDMAQQQLIAARFNLGYSQIRATTNGVVLKKFTNNGQIVGPGTPVLQTGSAGNNAWMLKVGVSDKEWARISLNDSATIQTGTTDGETLHAKVFSKAESADPYTGLFNIELKLLDGKNKAIASGMFGRAGIYASQQSQVWAIPYEALLDGNASEGFVFVTNDKKTAQKIPVKISSIEKDKILIDAGLEKSHFLVISGSAYLSDHSPIQVKP